MICRLSSNGEPNGWVQEMRDSVQGERKGFSTKIRNR